MSKKALDYIIYSNFIVAFSTGILTFGLLEYFKIPKALFYAVFSTCATLFVYIGQRLIKTTQYHSKWLEWSAKNKVWLAILMVASFVCAVFVLFIKIGVSSSSFLILFFSGLICVFYVVRIGSKNLREIKHLKIHLISAVWCVLLIVFPFLNQGVTEYLLALTILHYCYILAVAIPFDVRDLKYDLDAQKTIPQVLGIAKAKILSIGLLFVFALGMVLLFKDLQTNWLFLTAVIVQIVLVYFSNTKISDWYCAGLIDGCIALLGLSYLV